MSHASYLMEQMGGRISVDSSQTTGTEVKLSFLLAPTAPAAADHGFEV